MESKSIDTGFVTWDFASAISPDEILIVSDQTAIKYKRQQLHFIGRNMKNVPQKLRFDKISFHFAV